MAVVVWRPAGGHAGRRPDVAVVRIGTPGAVSVEVFIADDLLRHIAGRSRVVAATVALARPAVQVVVAPPAQRVVIGQAGAVEAIALPRRDGVRRVFAIDLGFTALNHDRRCIIIRIDVDAVFARAAQGECEIGRVHFETLVGPHVAHAHLERSLRKLHLGNPVVEVEQRYAGGRAEPDRGAADLQFGARIGVCPQTIASRQRSVDHRLEPVRLTRGRKTDRAAQIAQTRCA